MTQVNIARFNSSFMKS